jgi:hypothetical protein
MPITTAAINTPNGGCGTISGTISPRLLRKTAPNSEMLWRGLGSVASTARYQNRIWNSSGRLRISST